MENNVSSGGVVPLDTEKLTRPDYKHNGMFFAAMYRTQTPFVVTDPHQTDNPIVFANDAFVDMVGYTRDEIIGHNCRFLQGNDTDSNLVDQMRLFISELREFKTELLNYKKDGTPFWSSITITPVVDDAGEIAYFFASQVDITDRRIAEDKLRQSQKMEAMGNLTGGVAHDFNNLLTVIQGFGDILKGQINRDLPDITRMNKAINAILAAAEKGANLTSHLLSFSRKQNLFTSIVKLPDLIDTFSPLIKQAVGEGVELVINHSEGQCSVCIDTAQAESAILNIALNARDAMDGKGTLTISTESIDIDSAMGVFGDIAAGNYIHVKIQDSGCGMDPETVKRTIEPFFTTKPEGKGTGLGMSMVYGFVKQSGGVMTIQSKVSVGTIVHMLFRCEKDKS